MLQDSAFLKEVTDKLSSVSLCAQWLAPAFLQDAGPAPLGLLLLPNGRSCGWTKAQRLHLWPSRDPGEGLCSSLLSGPCELPHLPPFSHSCRAVRRVCFTA